MIQSTPTPSTVLVNQIAALDDALSRRNISLDPAGYFLIYIDREKRLLCAAHYTNTISDTGVALDPKTGRPLPCDGTLKRQPTQIYQGRSAKELGVQITENPEVTVVTRLDHALYLGREFVRAEQALLNGTDYVQD